MTKPDFATLDRTNIVAFLEDIFERRGGEEYLGGILMYFRVAALSDL